jgi:hypothetical protein
MNYLSREINEKDNLYQSAQRGNKAIYICMPNWWGKRVAVLHDHNLSRFSGLSNLSRFSELSHYHITFVDN